MIESIGDYFHYYEPIPQIICAVAIIALICHKKSVGKKYNLKCILVADISLLFVVGQFLYFHFQHNSPHYLFHDYKDGGRVDISEIVSVETSGSGSRTYYIFHLTNGSSLKWRESHTDIYSKSHKQLRWMDILDITDYK
jgi:hypothetical protein